MPVMSGEAARDRQFCVGCSRLWCRRCGGVSVGLTGLIFCSRCWARRAGVVHCTGRMAALVSELLGMRTRLSTDEGHRRGIRDVEAYMRAYLDHGLPATGTDVVCYAAYSVEMREFTLDSSTPQLLGLLKVLDKRYKKPSGAKDAFTLRQWCHIFHSGFILGRRSGRHHRLLFLFCTLGCLRRGGTKYLRVFYELLRSGDQVSIRWLAPPHHSTSHVMVVGDELGLSPFVRGSLDLDKNVDSRKPRRFYMPSEVPALGLRLVELLEDYIIREGVPSGSLLFAALAGVCVRLTGRRGQKAYRVYSGLDRRHTLLVCYGGWQLVQPFMVEIAVVARGHGKGAGFAVEKVLGVGGDGGITEVQLELLRSWGWP
eukprot:gene28743-biopygen29857